MGDGQDDILRPDFDRIPKFFRDLARWVLFKIELVDGRPAKVPYAGPNSKALANTPATWNTFLAVKQLYEAGGFAGIGWCRADDFVFFDLDGALDGSGGWAQWDWGTDGGGVEIHGPQPGEIYRRLEPYAYVETSVSGTGLHLILRTLARIPSLEIDLDAPHTGVGIYTASRYFTVSGEVWTIGDLKRDAGEALAEVIGELKAANERRRAGKRAAALAAAQAKAAEAGGTPPTSDLFDGASPPEPPRETRQPPPPAAPPSAPSGSAVPRLELVETPLSDWEILSLARREARFASVEAGDFSSLSDPSHSGGDLFLCQRLAFFSGGQAATVDSCFRQTGLYREDKWGREDYSSNTVALAISLCSEFYTRKKRGRPKNSGGSPRNSGGSAAPPPADAPGLDTFPFTDVGNAQRFRERHGGELRYSASLKSWFTWESGYWRPDTAHRALRLGIERAQAMVREGRETGSQSFVSFGLKSQAARKIDAMLSLTKALDPIAVPSDDLDRHPGLLNNQTGTSELPRKDRPMAILREHRREDLLTQMAGCAYTAGATHPAWTQFLETALPDPKTRSFLQKAAGYTLTGFTSEECCFLLVGEGRNGKGTFLHVMQTMLGDYATTASFETFLLSRRDQSAELATFRGKRMVVAQEAGSRATFNEAVLKSLTGGDRIKARSLYQNPFEYQPQFKLWFAMNHLPEVRDASPGFWSRIRVIRWPVNFAGNENRNLKAELTQPAALEAALAWAVEGCIRWQQEGLGSAPEVESATAEYREESDSIQFWIDERCVAHTFLQIQSSVAYSNYAEFCKSQNIPAAGRVAFKNSLEIKGYPSVKDNVIVFKGLQLKTAAYPDGES